MMSVERLAGDDTVSSSQSTLGALDLQSIEVNPEPFPSAIKEDFLGADLYAALKSTFPDCPSGSGPTAHNLYWGDLAFDKLLARHDCWREFFGLHPGFATGRVAVEPG